ncbi:MAG TPA: XRE family transcriptional regulator, partial [Allosphingosinicella sp.]|nr:XRE family transcriptional regulator [Allosphingosinicella sp.]
VAVPPTPSPGLVAMTVSSGVGDYRNGDEIWLNRIAPEDFASALNRDLLVPRPAGRYVFGRLIGREGSRIQILPLGAGGKQQVFDDPPWAAVAVKLIRSL